MEHKNIKPSFVVHINIRPSKSIHSTNNRTSNSSTEKSSRKILHIPSTIKIHPHDYYPFQVGQNVISDDAHRVKYVNEVWSDRKGVIKDYHRTSKRSRKKMCSPKQRIVASTITVLAIGIITGAILLGILIKSEATTTLPSSSFIPTLRWNSTGITVAGVSNTAGNASNQLNQPTDIALVYPNLLYIADSNNHRIQQYIIGSSKGTIVAGQANGLRGTSMNQLNQPSCILLDSSGGIFISDSGNNRVQYWPNGASTGSTVAGNTTGIAGITNSTFNNPVGLLRDESSGTIYVADFGNSRVMKYLLNAVSGSLAAGSSTFGTAPDRLWKPAGMYFDTLSNSLVIANHNAMNIVRWVLGASNWTLLADDANAISGNNATLLNYPQHVTFDPMGNMYVVDTNNHRIQLFMLGQTTGMTIAGITLTVGSNATLLNTPHAVRLDNQLNLYIADTNNHRIQKFLRY